MQKFPLLLLAVPALAFGSPGKVVHSSDFHPNPAFHPVRHYTTTKGAHVEQQGEVVILEGDETITTAASGGGYAVDPNGGDQYDIANRFYTKYGDDFDEIIVFTTFDDKGAAGALAYEISAQQDITGLGQDVFDDTQSYGSKGRLHAFVNMMKWDNYDSSSVPITDPRSSMYPTLGQEFAHRWLAFLTYKDAAGNNSTAMLGRDMAHWASTLQADGSLMDGNVLALGDDGYYSVSNFMTRYSSLDLYGMGIIPADQVAPFFLLKNAVTSTGKSVDPALYVRSGSKLKGTREDITIDQVVAGSGARTPAWDLAPHSFRIAFVLVTKPGETAIDAIDIAEKLDVARTVWEQKFQEYTGGRASVCTQVSTPCDVAVATARIAGGEVAEAGGNHNHVPEPGEPVQITFHLFNDSSLTARAISVSAEGDLVTNVPTSTVDELPPQGRQDVVFTGSVPADATCGAPITIDAASVVDGHTFRGFVEVTPGVRDAYSESFDAGRQGWIANPTGTDTATKNGWELGHPKGYRGFGGFQFQPNTCHSGSQCWFTGLDAGHRNNNNFADSALDVGESQLWSKEINLAGTYQPTLRYWAWFVGFDLSNTMQGVGPAKDVALVVEGSTDGGKTWVQLESFASSDSSWQRRDIPLDGTKLDLSRKLTLRFTINNPLATNLVEAGVDDVQLVTLTEACNPDAPAPTPPHKASGCGVTGDAPSTAGFALCLVAALLLVRRRRHA
jgi:MYXO-CTERM domain-containing protein